MNKHKKIHRSQKLSTAGFPEKGLDLAYQQGRSRLTGELFVSYERKVTFHTIFLTEKARSRL